MLAIRACFNSFRRNAAHTLEGHAIALHHRLSMTLARRVRGVQAVTRSMIPTTDDELLCDVAVDRERNRESIEFLVAGLFARQRRKRRRRSSEPSSAG
jgi:hypothetical protein